MNDQMSKSVFDDYPNWGRQTIGCSEEGRGKLTQREFNYRELLQNLNRVRPGCKGGGLKSKKVQVSVVEATEPDGTEEYS